MIPPAPTLAAEGSHEQKIVPCIWCGGNADELVAFYLSVFPNSEKRARTYYPTEGVADFQQSMAGKVLTIDFAIGGVRMTALNGGSEFTPTPMLSFIVNFDPSQRGRRRSAARQGLEAAQPGTARS